MPSEQPKKRGKLLRMPRQQTLVQKRLLDAAELLHDGDAEVAFQHTIFCQVSLPYRDPGDDVRLWKRAQGAAHLEIEAGRAFHSDKNDFVDVGLPFGPKARLLLAYLNTEAVRTGSPEIEVEDSLTAFVRRLFGDKVTGRRDPNGREIRRFKDQLARLAAAEIRLALALPGAPPEQVQTHIVGGFKLWPPKDERQRVLWPSTVTLSPTYFESLQRHAVPLDERALGALSHSAMALDLYAWLAQRLHRIPKPHRQLVPWVALKEQFGVGYDRVRKFREVFLQALRQVHVVYPAAKLEVNDRGLLLYTSPPPVAKTGVVVQLPAPSTP
jgi:hypothetical protein